MAIDDYSTPERHQGASRLMQQHGHLHLGTTLRTHHVVPIPCHGIRCMQCCGVRQHGVPCSAVLCGATLWYAVQCGAVRCLAMLCRTVQCGAAVWCGRASLSRASSGQAKLSQARLGSARLGSSRAELIRADPSSLGRVLPFSCHAIACVPLRGASNVDKAHLILSTPLVSAKFPWIQLCMCACLCMCASLHMHMRTYMCPCVCICAGMHVFVFGHAKASCALHALGPVYAAAALISG